ncbi:acyl-CoA-binding protein [Deinococcus metalli]|uniref:Acyl-CoA-binding protein n=1 Tax=Deinococcus metalli TaxID=1141878 RepID=A0A7W8NRQ6_9DEIO|nr:acyl-CoA-binding protein [Deinococcus metalli]MBB5379236.1 acyl-CoA-binding protein [Deinococcus metalli]GHF65637.1 acyl-CoA-binding protein [Deinococcus metalli]
MSAFEQARLEVQTLTRKPNTAQLLRLYALYKQGTLGDVQGERPGGFDLAGNAKHDAWAALRGMEPAQAQADYVALVASLRAAESRDIE